MRGDTGLSAGGFSRVSGLSSCVTAKVRFVSQVLSFSSMTSGLGQGRMANRAARSSVFRRRS